MKTEIKELVAEGKVDEALNQLVAFLESQIDQYSPLYRAAQVAQSEFHQIREKELLGLLTEDQIRLANNVAINKVLEILEQLDRGPMAVSTSSPNRRVWWWYGAGGAALTLVIVLIVNGITRKGGIDPQPGTGDSTQVVDIPSFTCPVFNKNTEYPIAVFNFTTLNPKDSVTDKLLVEAIDGIFARNNYQGDAALVVSFKGSVDMAVAKAMVEKCNARMVIWGRVFDNSEIDLNFYEPQLSPDQRAELDSLLQFRDQGNFKASIKQAALIIASRVLVVNNAKGAVAVAEEAFKETMETNGPTTTAKSAKKSNTESMATMTLANAHAKNKDYLKSIKLYDQILDKKPGDTVALKNRAIVQIKVNDIKGAVKSIDSLKYYQKQDDPLFLDKAGDLLKERGWTTKGIEFKKDAKDAQRAIDQRVIKNLPQDQ